MIQSLFNEQQNYYIESINLPDDFIGTPGTPPPANFVICYDHNKKPTAIYGESTWDLNPYRLSADKMNILSFDIRSNFDNEHSKLGEKIESELRYLVFNLIYFCKTGRTGQLTAGGILSYYQGLKFVAKWCYQNREHPFLKGITIKDVLSNSTYLNAFLSTDSLHRGIKHRISAVLTLFSSISKKRLGFSPVEYSIKKLKSNQTPIIPIRIYAEIINNLMSELNLYLTHQEKLTDFIKIFEDPMMGLCHGTQKTRKVKQRDYRPNLSMLAKTHDLTALFDFENKNGLVSKLIEIQWIIIQIIGFYTGMRRQEIKRMPYNCIFTEITYPGKYLDDKINNKDQVISLISTTTKFTGIRDQQSWIATNDVIDAILLAQKITKGLSHIYGIKPEECPLFACPTVITFNERKLHLPRVVNPKKNRALKSVMNIKITEDDFSLLAASDPNRDFTIDSKFSVGSPWPLNLHQFRRSLAFYAASSGLVSITSLRRQFKHLSDQMSRYYQSGYENIISIFGYYDEKTKTHILPKDHILFEFQVAVPISMVELIAKDILSDSELIFGGAGTYINKSKASLQDGTIDIRECKDQTLKLVKNGEVSYKKTLLGGCMKISPCAHNMMGEITECLICPDSVIKPKKLSSLILSLKSESKQHDKGSGEWQVLNLELTKLQKFQANNS